MEYIANWLQTQAEAQVTASIPLEAALRGILAGAKEYAQTTPRLNAEELTDCLDAVLHRRRETVPDAVCDLLMRIALRLHLFKGSGYAKREVFRMRAFMAPVTKLKLQQLVEEGLDDLCAHYNLAARIRCRLVSE